MSRGRPPANFDDGRKFSHYAECSHGGHWSALRVDAPAYERLGFMKWQHDHLCQADSCREASGRVGKCSGEVTVHTNPVGQQLELF